MYDSQAVSGVKGEKIFSMPPKVDTKSSDFDRRFIQRLKPLAALRQKEIAAKMGYDQQAISRWVNGAAIKAEDLFPLAAALEVDLVWLLTGKDSHMPGGDINMSWLEASIDLVEAALADREGVPSNVKAAWIRRAYELFLEGRGQIEPRQRTKLLALIKKT